MSRVGKPGDAMTYLLQAIVLDQKHRGVRAELCRYAALVTFLHITNKYYDKIILADSSWSCEST